MKLVLKLLTLGKPYTEKDRFSELLKDIELFVNNDMDANDFEDKTRELFWTSGYIIFTVDKLVQAIVKQVMVMLILDASHCFRFQMPRAFDYLHQRS